MWWPSTALRSIMDRDSCTKFIDTVVSNPALYTGCRRFQLQPLNCLGYFYEGFSDFMSVLASHLLEALGFSHAHGSTVLTEEFCDFPDF